MGNLEHPHDVQNKVRLFRTVYDILAGVALERRSQNFTDMLMGQHAVFAFLFRAQNQAVNAVRQPYGFQYPQAFQTQILLFLPIGIRHPKVAEPIQEGTLQIQFLYAVVHADFPVLVRRDVRLRHVFKGAFHGEHPLVATQGLRTGGRAFHNGVVKPSREELLARIGGGRRFQNLLQGGVTLFQRRFVDTNAGVLVGLVQGKDNRTVGRVGINLLQPAHGVGVQVRVVPHGTDHNIDRVVRQETAVHGVHDFLSAEVHESHKKRLSVQFGFPRDDAHALRRGKLA